MNPLLLLFFAAGPAPPPAAWKPLIGEYGTPPNLTYILEQDGVLMRYSEKSGYDTLDPKSIQAKKDSEGAITEVTIGKEKLARHRLPSAVITPVRPIAELREEALQATPPAEEGVFRTYDLVELTFLNTDFHLDIRYATANNFLGTPIYTQARAFLQSDAAEALVKALADLRKQGFGLLIYDAYRPWYVTKMFWEAVPPEDKVFVADPAKGSKHNRGCAVDLTLYDLNTGKPVEMTGNYDEMSDRSYPNYPGGTSLQRWHRAVLHDAMEAHGFTVYEAEWWHFDYKDWEKYPILNIPFEQIK